MIDIIILVLSIAAIISLLILMFRGKQASIDNSASTSANNTNDANDINAANDANAANTINAAIIVSDGLTSSGLDNYESIASGFDNIDPLPTTTQSEIIIFDSIEKIMINFEKFIDLYFSELKDIIEDINNKISEDTDFFPSGSTVYSIYEDAASHKEYRDRFNLKPIINIYSHLILTEENEEIMNARFDLAMIGLIIFLNANDINKTYELDNNDGSTKSNGNLIFKYNSDYKINGLKFFMETELNKDKPKIKKHSLDLTKECIKDNICFTTSEDLKSIYLKDDQPDKEKKRLKEEVKNNEDNYKKILKLLFIANLKLMLNSDYNDINEVINDNNDKNHKELNDLKDTLNKVVKKRPFESNPTVSRNDNNDEFIKLSGDYIIYKNAQTGTTQHKIKRIKLPKDHGLDNQLKTLKDNNIKIIKPTDICKTNDGICIATIDLLDYMCSINNNNNTDKTCIVLNELQILNRGGGTGGDTGVVTFYGTGGDTGGNTGGDTGGDTGRDTGGDTYEVTGVDTDEVTFGGTGGDNIGTVNAENQWSGTVWQGFN
jgi:hypothetical protein